MKTLKRLMAGALLTSSCMTTVIAPTGVQAAEAYKAALIVRDLPSEARATPIQVHYWYPSLETQRVERFDSGKLFTPVEIIPEAQAAPGEFPVVLLAHGGMRSVFTHTGWIASTLARQGFIVVVPKPPGGRELKPANAVNELFLRPADLSLALSALGEVDRIKDSVDSDNVSGVGFFLGGTSMLALAGAKLNPEGYRQSCSMSEASTPRVNIDCRWLQSAGVDLTTLPEDLFEHEVSDERITNLVVVNPELTQVLELRSLEEMQLPVKLIDLTSNRSSPLFPAEQLGHIPRYSVVSIESATAYSAFSECTPVGLEVLQAEGEAELCVEPSGRSRADIHQQLIDEIVEAIAAGRSK